MNLSATVWSDLSGLLDEALDLDAVDRAGWLERQCEAQPERAVLLRKLLAAHATSQTADVLARLPTLAAGPEPAHAGLAVGDRVGPYRLKRELGFGGMADVWLAERADGAFERDVALKLPRINRLRGDLAIRFARERDILARLEHPHIARLYDAGVADDGLSYLAMEHVDGQPIGTYCDSRQLDITARLHLFAQVQGAVQFAHANLVIHRDLKPSNILVTTEGQVRLLDFGIAKLLAGDESGIETELTQHSGRALTPDYASPEQIQGKPLTIACDVYSLGVVLYELLAGQRPYRLKLESAAQLEQAIVSIDPPPASESAREPALAKRLRGDLDAILNKALKKVPSERYASVEAFAADLERHLRGQPVQARPDSLWYRASRFLVRRKLETAVVAAILVAIPAGAAAQAAVLFAIASGAAVALWQTRAARRQAQFAREQAARAEEVKKFVLSFFEAADADRGGGRQTTAVDLLKQARQRLSSTPIGDAATRVELLTTIGAALRVMGELQPAGEVLAEATRLAGAMTSHDDIAAPAHAVYGALLFQKGEVKLAELQLDAAQECSRRAGDMRWLSSALSSKSVLRSRELRHDEAIDLARKALVAAERQSVPTDKGWVVAADIQLSYALRGAHRGGALEPAQHAYALACELWRDRPTAAMIEAQAAYAKALAYEGRVAEAFAEMKVVAQRQSAMLGPEHIRFAETLRTLGAMSLRLGDPTAAIDSLRDALRIESVNSQGKPNSTLASTRMTLGSALANAHRYSEALAEWREADRGCSAIHGPQHQATRLSRSAVAWAMTRLGRLDEADAIFAALLAEPFRSAGEEGLIKRRLGQLRSEQGRHDEALALLRGAPAPFADGSRDGLHALALAELGNALLTGGRFAESLETSSQAQSLLLQSQPAGSPDRADVALDIARAHLALGHAQDALRAAEEAAAFWSRFDGSHPDAGVALLWLARALAATGCEADAHDTLRQAAAIIASAGLPGDRALLERTQRELGGQEAARR